MYPDSTRKMRRWKAGERERGEKEGEGEEILRTLFLLVVSIQKISNPYSKLSMNV